MKKLLVLGLNGVNLLTTVANNGGLPKKAINEIADGQKSLLFIPKVILAEDYQALIFDQYFGSDEYLAEYVQFLNQVFLGKNVALLVHRPFPEKNVLKIIDLVKNNFCNIETEFRLFEQETPRSIQTGKYFLVNEYAVEGKRVEPVTLGLATSVC